MLIAGIAGFEMQAFGGQLGGEGCRAGRADVVMQGVSLGGLLEGVPFGFGGEPELAADFGWGSSAGALALKDLCFELTAV